MMFAVFHWIVDDGAGIAREAAVWAGGGVLFAILVHRSAKKRHAKRQQRERPS